SAGAPDCFVFGHWTLLKNETSIMRLQRHACVPTLIRVYCAKMSNFQGLTPENRADFS
ncbi:MAG: hypothetical protein ACI8YI_002286, partial [Paracoccaceae bacterium]